MNLPSPVTITFPPITLPDGTTRQLPPKEFAALNVTILDNATGRRCLAEIFPFMARGPVTLWQDDAYDAAGDYTQAQVEARLLEVLGPDIKASLERLLSR